MWWVYILKCKDNTYYVGLTDNVSRRFSEHSCGVGANHVKVRGASSICYTEHFRLKKTALLREKQLKKWSRIKKEALIAKNFDELRRLSALK